MLLKDLPTFYHLGKLTSACHSHQSCWINPGLYSGQYSGLPSPRLTRFEGCGFLAPTSVSTVPSSRIKSQSMVSLWYVSLWYGCESWTTKKAEWWRIDAFELWCWRRLESPLDCKEIQPVHPKGDQSWVFFGRNDAEAETPILLATWCEQLTHLKRPWCWERLNAGGEGDNRGWNGWMASPTQWAWAWVNSRSWWRTGRPGMLQSMGSQRVGYNWVTELNLWSWACPLIFSWEMCDDSKENAGNAWKISPKWIYTYTLVQFILNSTRCSFLFSCVLLS